MQQSTPGAEAEAIVRAICTRCVRAHMNFLASDALRGRGSGTQDELVAATYIASEFEQYGVEPAGDNGSYIQRATLLRRTLTARPKLTFHPAPGSPATTWLHGKQFVVLALGQSDISAPLQKYDASSPPELKSGAFVLVTHLADRNMEELAYALGSEGAAAIILPETAQLRSRWKALAAKNPSLPVEVEGNQKAGIGPRFTVVAVNSAMAEQLGRLRNGTLLHLYGPAGKTKESYTWNVIGKVAGTDPTQAHHDVLLTAHLDHLGVGAPVNGDEIYNGADDDASGTTAVLELARALAAGSKPRRTVIFTLFGSEEKGGLGSLYFRAHAPVAMNNIAAYLEFEMIGRPDAAVPRDSLWLSGWNRTNLGPELAKHGAHLVADPHPA